MYRLIHHQHDPFVVGNRKLQLIPRVSSSEIYITQKSMSVLFSQTFVISGSAIKSHFLEFDVCQSDCSNCIGYLI